jgi:hypothetical protein
MMLGLASGLAACAGPSGKSTPAPTTAVQSPVATASAPAVTEKPSEAASGVDQSAALDNYVAAAQASIPTIMDSSPGTYTQVQILATQPDTVEFVYTYAKAVDPSAAAAYLDTMIPTLQTASETSMFPEMKTAGITASPKVRFTYVNSDGTQLWSHVFGATS